MATIKSYTDINQSKKLVEILPLESADMCYLSKDGRGIDFFEEPVINDGTREDNDIPCWGLAALLSVLPILERSGYRKAKPQLLYCVTINKWIVDSHVYTTDAYDNPVDACYEMILKLHELNLL